MELSVAAMKTCSNYSFYEGGWTSKLIEVKYQVVTSLNVDPPLHRAFTICQHSSQARCCGTSTSVPVEASHRAAVWATFRSTVHLLLRDVDGFVRVVGTNCVCITVVRH